MSNVTFLRPRPYPAPLPLERPLDEHEVFRIWHRAGVIQRMPPRPWRLHDSIVGLLAVGFSVGFCCAYFWTFRP